MAKKTTIQIDSDLRDIETYKWQFLRRNVSYIKDCEKWSGRKKHNWTTDEIVLGYKFKGKLNSRYELRGRTACADLWKYYEKNCIAWNNLTMYKQEEERLNRKGLFCPSTPHKYTWKKYADKWSINLPFNPKIDFVPFFVSISPVEVIRQQMGDKRKIKNDIFLQRGTDSWIRVNWAVNKNYIRHEFDKILVSKQKMLKLGDALKDNKAMFSMFETYLRIWDLRNDYRKHYTFPQIAERVYPQGSYKDWDTTTERVKKNYRVAEGLVNGGYKKIGARGK